MLMDQLSLMDLLLMMVQNLLTMELVMSVVM